MTGIDSTSPPLPMPAFLEAQSAMTEQEAGEFLGAYRSLLKTWTMAVAGFTDADGDMLSRELEARRNLLAEIATFYPAMRYSVDMLINARSRAWPGYMAERLPRPQGRQS